MIAGPGVTAHPDALQPLVRGRGRPSRAHDAHREAVVLRDRFAVHLVGDDRVRYQLFPHPLAPWLIDPNGRPLPDEVFDPATWQRNGWNVYDPDVVSRISAAQDGDETYLAELRRYFL